MATIISITKTAAEYHPALGYTYIIKLSDGQVLPLVYSEEFYFQFSDFDFEKDIQELVGREWRSYDEINGED